MIQITGPDMLLNNRGEWNACSIPRLVLEDKEPVQEWLSNSVKVVLRKAITGCKIVVMAG